MQPLPIGNVFEVVKSTPTIIKMKKLYFLLIVALITANLAKAQSCNCETNFEWVKKTFEQNDAGFKYVIDSKGKQAYEDHNKRILAKIKEAKTLNDCTPILYEWLTFFRSGHIAIRQKNQNSSTTSTPAVAEKQFPDWETLPVDLENFKTYLKNKKEVDYEGIWQTSPYQIGIKKVNNEYLGFIIESGAASWTKGQIKLRITPSMDSTSSVFYMRDHSATKSNQVKMTGKNNLQIGNFSLSRTYPELKDDQIFVDYFKLLSSSKPYLTQLNPTTLYLRIPSFQPQQKKSIDSVININKAKILKTPNLIIDIRSGTGGSDNSFSSLIPLIYTNPIREVGVEYLSTKLNNQRMLDFINKPDYGFSEEDKKWAKESYDKLEKQLGKFVNLNDDVVGLIKKDKVLPFPKNVGIIINGGNGSTDEQFLLAAKQSKKVKLFGTTTFGVLDISNMYFVDSPCKEFELGYSLTRSMRIPDFTIDAKGIQPDYFMDRSIPPYQWVEQTSQILNQK